MPAGNTTLESLQVIPALILFGAVILPGLWPGLSQSLPGTIRAWLKSSALVVTTMLALAFCIRLWAVTPDGRLHLTVFDQNGAPVVLIEDPSGLLFLINGGPSANRLNGSLGQRLSPLDHHLDGLLVSDCRTAWLDGLAAATERFPVRSAFWTCPPPDSKAGRALSLALEDQRLENLLIDPGGVLALSQGIRLEVLDAGEESSALLLSWGKFKALLPGTLPPSDLALEKAYAPSLLIIEGNLLADTAPEDVQSLAPLAVLATRVDDPTIAIPSNWLYTRRWGWFSIITDGNQMWMEQSR